MIIRDCFAHSSTITTVQSFKRYLRVVLVMGVCRLYILEVVLLLMLHLLLNYLGWPMNRHVLLGCVDYGEGFI